MRPRVVWGPGSNYPTIEYLRALIIVFPVQVPGKDMPARYLDPYPKGPSTQ